MGEDAKTVRYDGRTKFESQEPMLRMLAEKGELTALQRNAERAYEYMKKLDRRSD
ncbi:MAG: hypothetical protein KGH57_04245 [Candidatus Micrarchaeota archaeon]|nr:hypothetical protein [Candidatus Micrarchaeota archaeon]